MVGLFADTGSRRILGETPNIRLPQRDIRDSISKSVSLKRLYVYVLTYFPIPFVLQPGRLCHSPFRFIVNSIYLAVAYHSLVKYHVRSTSKVLTRATLRIYPAILNLKYYGSMIYRRYECKRVIPLYLAERDKFRTSCEFFDYKFSNKFQTGSFVDASSYKMSFVDAGVINHSLQEVITQRALHNIPSDT